MNEEISSDNGRKLDRLIQLLEGEPGAPGVVSRVAMLERTMNGEANSMGMATKVTVMWRVHIWLLCAFSALAGYLIKTIATSAHLMGFIH